MSEEKPLKPAELRKAFGETRDRLTKLEEKVRDQEAEAKARTDYIRNVQKKVDKLTLELDDALPKMVMAEAQLGRANATIDRLWGAIGSSAHDLDKLRTLVRDALEKRENVGDSGE